MKIKIKPKYNEPLEEAEELLLIEPDPEHEDYYLIHKSLIDDLIKSKDLIAESRSEGITDPQKWCEERGFFSLKSLLIKINAIQQAAKGKFGK